MALYGLHIVYNGLLILYCLQIFVSLIQGGSATLVKAEVPWSARRGSLSDKDRVLKTVKG